MGKTGFLKIGFKNFQGRLNMSSVAVVFEHGGGAHGKECSLDFCPVRPAFIDGEVVAVSFFGDEADNLAAVEAFTLGPEQMFKIDGIIEPVSAMDTGKVD